MHFILFSWRGVCVKSATSKARSIDQKKENKVRRFIWFHLYETHAVSPPIIVYVTYRMTLNLMLLLICVMLFLLNSFLKWNLFLWKPKANTEGWRQHNHCHRHVPCINRYASFKITMDAKFESRNIIGIIFRLWWQLNVVPCLSKKNFFTCFHQMYW